MKNVFIGAFCSFLFLTTSAQTTGTLSVTATTSQTTTPTYKPKNIVAMWIEDANGNFVKTLLALTSERRQYLVNWRTKTTLAGSAYNTVDAVTGATQTSHGVRTASWNGKNRSQILVADGNYTLKMEVTDNDGVRQNLAAISFTKGTSSQTLTPAATNGFSAITIRWTPSTTPVPEVKENELFSIYPTRIKSVLFVRGTAIQYIEITDLNGRIILKSKEPNIIVAQLPSATYFATIYSNEGTFVRRFIKE